MLHYKNKDANNNTSFIWFSADIISFCCDKGYHAVHILWKYYFSIKIDLQDNQDLTNTQVINRTNDVKGVRKISQSNNKQINDYH